jgi:hypothetical protein
MHMPACCACAVLAVCSLRRLGVLSLLFIPALGWVAFNILQPALNQLNRMNEIKDDAKGSSGRGAGGKKKRGLAGAVGLGAALSMMAAQQADAATELSQLAASDNRWVLQTCCCVRDGGCMHESSSCLGAALPCWHVGQAAGFL